MLASALFCLRRALFLAALFFTPLNLASQVVPAGYGGPSGPIDPKWDFFGAYSYLAPSGSIPPGSGPTAPGAPGTKYGQINWGSLFGAARYFSNHWGVEIEGDEHVENEPYPPGSQVGSFDTDDDFAGFEGGLVFRYPIRRFTPFGHAMYGSERVGEIFQPDHWGTAFTVGGGVDWHYAGRWSLRIAQADEQRVYLSTNNVSAFRLSSGIVFHLGSTARANTH